MSENTSEVRPVVSAPESKDRLQVASTVQAFKFYSGPIPDPETLANFERAFPGAANRILKMAELEGEHRRNQESKQLSGNIADAKAARAQIARGQYCGLVACALVMAAAVTIAVSGQSWVSDLGGSLLGVGGLAGIIGVFMWGKKEDEPAKEKAEPKETLNVVPSTTTLPLFDQTKA